MLAKPAKEFWHHWQQCQGKCSNSCAMTSSNHLFASSLSLIVRSLPAGWAFEEPFAFHPFPNINQFLFTFQDLPNSECCFPVRISSCFFSHMLLPYILPALCSTPRPEGCQLPLPTMPWWHADVDNLVLPRWALMGNTYHLKLTYWNKILHIRS